ncbi:KAT8 regulatory NSL complex subunit 1-like protein [Leptodactylus fuscus]|uniref:KAT8 regulatory NSL complex subunit 1-like protein n=1 Tax=Leptodactylus fuscus TaxID=238119 RepID=UPI003F4E81D0
MTLAPTDTGPRESGVHFSPLGIKSLSANLNVCLYHSKTGSKDGSSSIAYGDPARRLQEDFTSFQQDESLSSAHYQTVFVLTTSPDTNVQGNSSIPLETEQDSYRQRSHGQHDTRPLLTERKVKRQLFPGTVSKVLADVNKLWDISVSEDEGIHRLNGRIDGESLAIPFASICTLPNLRCISPVSNKLQKTVDKETEAKLLRLKCLKRQRELLNRVQRARKHLQLFLAKCAVDHCSQQISGIAKHTLERVNAHHNCTSQPCTDVHTDPDVGLTTSACTDVKHGAPRDTSTAIRRFSASAAQIIGCIQQELDSDVTENSSDEEWDDNPKKTHDCTAELNWLSGRADIGSRWTWLQAQIAELEYKIHHLGDLHSHLRNKKRKLVFHEYSNCVLGEETHLPYPGASLQSAETLATPLEETDPAMDLEMSPSSPTLLLRNIEKQSARLTEMVSSVITATPTSPVKPFADGRMSTRAAQGISKLQKTGTPNRNGLGKRQPVKKKKRIRVRASSILTNSAARTRPLLLFHKQNLYRLIPGCTPLHLALPSPQPLHGSHQQISDCSPTNVSGDKLQTPVLVKRNVCELDPNFHPVLSLPSDLPLHLHLEGLLKCKSDIMDDLSSRIFTPGDDENVSYVPPKWSKSCASIASLPLVLETPSRERRPGNLAKSGIYLGLVPQPDDLSVTPTSQKTSVQLQARDPNVLSATRRRVRSESSYDIDNIVIPMNLVAPSKLEKLQYKEILTPSWKEVALEPLKSPPCEEMEDLSDEAFLIRHQKYEQSERVRWSFWEQRKWPKRNRSSSHSSGQCPENIFLCTEDDCSSDSTLPVSWETAPPGGCNSQSLHSRVDFHQGKAEYWERRIFPLTGEAAAALKQTSKPTDHSSCTATILPTLEEKGVEHLHSSCDKENR